MRKLAIAMALASTAIATPAVARDHSFYAGLEGGVMSVEDISLDYRDVTQTIPAGYVVNFGTGYDVDAIAGYDFGVLRLEGELSYKHAGVDGVNADPRISPVGNGNLDGGRVNVFSAMVNALLDFGNDKGLSGYVGGGAGWASIDLSAATATPGSHVINDSQSHFAMQAIAGVRLAVSQNIDVGFKVRTSSRAICTSRTRSTVFLSISADRSGRTVCWRA